MRFIAKRKDEIAKVTDAASEYVVGMAELEKAIKYHEEMQKERYLNDGSHKQYAEWLKELKGLRLLLDWAIECDFGYDDIPEEYEKYKHKIKERMEHKQEPKWIPITSRPMTDDEREHYKTHPEYQDDCRIFNCKLPDDGQEVLISIYGRVEVDTFIQDANDGCYFEGVDIDDVDAWMPPPEPYKESEEDNAKSDVEVCSSNFIQLKQDVLNNNQLWQKLREIEDEDSD